MISLRTKDDVTLAASRRLFALGSTSAAIASLDRDAVAEAIYPAGFYRTKATNILEVCRIINSEHDGRVPGTLEELVDLPGVGRKTANLVLGLGFGIESICVDTHVHRIPNRLGWIRTAKPEETEQALMAILPRAYWIEINELLVGFGQTTCTPVSPWCSRCPLADQCARHGVDRTR